MADSDNSRTLSSVTRGDFHSVLAASLTTDQAHFTPQISLPETCRSDPALSAWHDWRIAWGRLVESTVRQQQLETALFSGDLTSSAGPDGSRAYSKALEAEDCAAIAEEEAAQALWKASAASVAGVTAKLDAILSRGQPSLASPDEPWPQIRDVMTDLLRIDMALDPAIRLTVRCEPELRDG